MSKNDFSCTIKKGELLERLRDNYERHVTMLSEATEGFIAKARSVLEEKLALLKSGKSTSISLNMRPPEDHSVEYKTAISMTEMHQGETIELGAEDFRNLVMDEWGWLGMWLQENRRMSKTADNYASSKMIS